ncbi:MAG: hypothetical protein DMD75_08295 [Candidatus Rokuibacteriota bacterium]|nr:MAG: hypothetical protein DMD75_08295 [Candidatus Rokubacteria bacterium]
MTGEALRRIRKRLGLTQRAFAAQLGLHPNSLARQERGELGIKESVARLAGLLGKTGLGRRSVRKFRQGGRPR